MDLRSCHPFWLVRNGLLNTFPALDKDITCDVVVIGGGITGALVGYHLVEAGISAVVLDKRDIGWGSTAASTAMLQYEIDTPLYELTAKLGKDHATRSYHACRDAIYKLQTLTGKLADKCGFELKPSLYLAKRSSDRAVMKKEFEARSAAGFETEWWNASDVKRHLGFDKPCAIYSRDGGQVDAYRLAYKLLERAMEMGLKVHDRTQLLGYQVEGSRVLARTDRGTTVRAKHIIFASGYESQDIVSKKLVSLRSTFALVSEPLKEKGHVWHQDCLIWEHANPYLYMRTTDDHRVIVGGEDEKFTDPDRRDAMVGGKTKTLLRKFRHLFPDIPLEVAFSWAGVFGETKDGLAYIDKTPEFPRAYFTLGFGGNGITYSVIAAEIVRDDILGRSSPYSDLFRFNR